MESPKNPRVKALLRLRQRRARERDGRMLVEGAREALRALEAGVTVQEAYLCPTLLRGEGAEVARRLRDAGVPVVETSPRAFERLSLRQKPDGVLLVVGSPERDPATLTLPEDALVLVLDGLEKPGNVGAALRSADAAGADAVALAGEGTDLANPNVVRASMGSLFHVPVVQTSGAALRAFLEGRGVRLVAATPEAPVPYWEADLTGPVALVLGTEHAGLGAEWRQAPHEAVQVPMRGAADSLNVATVAALLLFEARRQRATRL